MVYKTDLCKLMWNLNHWIIAVSIWWNQILNDLTAVSIWQNQILNDLLLFSHNGIKSLMTYCCFHMKKSNPQWLTAVSIWWNQILNNTGPFLHTWYFFGSDLRKVDVVVFSIKINSHCPLEFSYWGNGGWGGVGIQWQRLYFCLRSK